MRALIFAVLAAGCSLDVSSKPECLVDNDCYYTLKGHCAAQICVGNAEPVGRPDVVYILNESLPTKVVADVTLNDFDADGDPLTIKEVGRHDQTTGYIARKTTTTVEIEVTDIPSTYAYTIADPFVTAPTWHTITVAQLDPSVTIQVEEGTSASLVNVFGSVIEAAAVELVASPTVGTLVGTLPDVTYTPPPGYCGPASATYRIHAASGTVDVVVTFAVGILLADDQRAIEFGSPTTIDVLANDRAGLEVVATNQPFATVGTANDAVVVEPPVGLAQDYDIVYTARDTRGCEGVATLRLDVGFPTRVVVGEGIAGDAFDATLSHDGRFLAFTSAAATLVSGDTNGTADVFVRDLSSNVVERVSVASSGAQANEGSSSPTISADGRWVAFVSRATNLDSADTTSVEDIYLHDRTTGATTLVSISVDGTGSDQSSLTPHISEDGSRIAFASSASRLVENDTNDVLDIFVRDLGTTTTTRISTMSTGAQVPFASRVRPRISGNGRYVALTSSSSLDGSGQGGAFLVDTTGSAVSRIHASSGEVDIDDAGRFVVHASYSVTVLDRVVENTTDLGTGTYPALSADGEYVVFANAKRVLARGTGGGVAVDVIVDRAGDVVPVTPLRRPEISGDGRWVVFATSEWPGHQGRFVIVRVWNRAHDGS